MNNELLQQAKDKILGDLVKGVPAQENIKDYTQAYLSLCQAEQTEFYTQIQVAQEPLQMEMQKSDDT